MLVFVLRHLARRGHHPQDREEDRGGWVSGCFGAVRGGLRRQARFRSALRLIPGAGAYFAALSVILNDEASEDGHPMTPPTGR